MFLQQLLIDTIAKKKVKEVETLLLLFPSLAYENSAERYLKNLAKEKHIAAIVPLWTGSDFGFDPLTYQAFEFLHAPEYEEVKKIFHNPTRQRISELASLAITDPIRKWIANGLYVLTNVEPIFSTRTLKFESVNAEQPQAIAAPHMRFNLKSKEQAAVLKRLLSLFGIPCYGGMKNHFFLVTVPITSFDNIYRIMQGLTNITRSELDAFEHDGCCDEEYSLLFNFCFNLAEEAESIKMRAKNEILAMQNHQIVDFINAITASIELRIMQALQSVGGVPTFVSEPPKERIELFARLLNIPQPENINFADLQKSQKATLIKVLFHKEWTVPERVQQHISKMEVQQLRAFYSKTLSKCLPSSCLAEENTAWQITNTFTPRYDDTQMPHPEEDIQQRSKKRKFVLE